MPIEFQAEEVELETVEEEPFPTIDDLFEEDDNFDDDTLDDPFE
jgi:hypothetical protein